MKELEVLDCNMADGSMSGQFIKVDYDTEQPTISARDLHERLNIETPFKKWIDRMIAYGFVEEKDFWTKMSESTGGRPSTDYTITIDMAKEIAMIQRSPEGKQIRIYLIELEKAWNTPELVFARAVKMADIKINDLKQELGERDKLIEVKDKQLELKDEQLKIQEPAVDYVRAVSKTPGTSLFRDVAKLLSEQGFNIGQNKLMRFLRDEEILMKNNIPYQKYMNMGLFEVCHVRKNGKIRTTTYVTKKGEVYISKKVNEKYRG